MTDEDCHVQSLTLTFEMSDHIRSSNHTKEWTAEYRQVDWNRLILTISITVPSVQEIRIQVTGFSTESWRLSREYTRTRNGFNDDLRQQ